MSVHTYAYVMLRLELLYSGPPTDLLHWRPAAGTEVCVGVCVCWVGMSVGVCVLGRYVSGCVCVLGRYVSGCVVYWSLSCV